jgi:NitT/TauT family transport system substrate-binding protein
MRHLLAATLAIGLLLAASCDQQEGQGQQQDVKNSAVLKQVRLGYFANLTHAQAVLGASSGEFAKAIAPTALKTQVFNAGPSLIEALLAGEIDIAYVGPGPALAAQQRTHGQGIRVIAGAAANGVVIVASEASGIHSMEDLKGKRLATPQHGNTQDIAARHYVTAVLKQPDASTIVPISNAEQVGMMTRNQIDAAWAPEPWGSVLIAQAGAHVVGEEKDLWPSKEFTLTVVVTTPEFLSAHPDVVEKILKVHRNWTARLQQDPKSCETKLADALFGLTGKKLPAGILPAALARVKFTDEPFRETFSTLGQWSYDLGFERRPPNLGGLFDTSILSKLKTETPPATQPAG